VKIYIRALGAHEESAEFLSYMSLQVKKSDENEMAYMFDAAANETAQLTDGVCLGMLYSGGEVNLDVILHVSNQMGNEFQNYAGYLDWEFMVEEFPVEPDDPVPPTGDNSNVLVWMLLLFASLILFVIFWKKREREAEQTA
jgi:LPXTG-motif cell wall-anchored protein